MRILIACEFSGVVRSAFNAYSGIHATSCDLLPAEDGRCDDHIIGDVRGIIHQDWDAMICFWPCTFLCNSGVRWLDRGLNGSRMAQMIDHAFWFNQLLGEELTSMAHHIPFVAMENPIQHKYARERIRKPDQIIQPWMFGHGETKATCLWLKNLPKLEPTNIVEGRTPRVHHASPGPDRWKERSRTLPGIAQAMASQWIPHILNAYSQPLS
jgi:hypothetical protein